ncbi:Uncharacterised protein [Vibrio metschnikovii]|uniref:hypothetical protein n=1 Tax=Vibrio metschnikovii TaxID=28172 RepID=UPI0005934120|nr:hypothetical protein [Vibrio metschnikovii]SUP49790.1 Uncharacterised protein [Vibrio metschnikovii]SUQ10219.1 Uncharacterised protein [Vibrio metschnikovii]
MFVEITNSDVIAFSSVFIALIALVVAIIQGVVARKHNVLTLKPVLFFESMLSPRDGVSINFRNHGQGPAFVEAVYYKFNGQKYPISSPSSYDDLVKTMGALRLKDVEFSIMCNLSISSVVVPSQGEAVFLQFFNYDSTPILDEEKNRKIIESLPEFEIYYKCSYGKKYMEKWRVSNPVNLL